MSLFISGGLALLLLLSILGATFTPPWDQVPVDSKGVMTGVTKYVSPTGVTVFKLTDDGTLQLVSGVSIYDEEDGTKSVGLYVTNDGTSGRLHFVSGQSGFPVFDLGTSGAIETISEVMRFYHTDSGVPANSAGYTGTGWGEEISWYSKQKDTSYQKIASIQTLKYDNSNDYDTKIRFNLLGSSFLPVLELANSGGVPQIYAGSEGVFPTGNIIFAVNNYSGPRQYQFSFWNSSTAAVGNQAEMFFSNSMTGLSAGAGITASIAAEQTTSTVYNAMKGDLVFKVQTTGGGVSLPEEKARLYSDGTFEVDSGISTPATNIWKSLSGESIFVSGNTLYFTDSTGKDHALHLPES